MYQNSKIYKLVNDVDDRIYIGSTCNRLATRLGQHKSAAKQKTDRHVYSHLNTIGWDSVRIIQIEALECKNKNELLAREQHYIDELKPELNKRGAIDDCPHGRRKFQCKECGGGYICGHGRERNRCKDCGGSQICPHNKRKSYCKQCSPYYCEYCDLTTTVGNKKPHDKSKNHIKNFIQY